MKMLPTVIANLLSKPATRNYPFDVREPFASTRGELVNDIERCIFCGSCSRKCPSQCITVSKEGNNGVWSLDFFACIGCGICVMACPVSSLSQKPTHRPVATARATITLTGKLPEKPAKKTEKGAAAAADFTSKPQ
jgi:formate hydrogenlyase subunit 6/NADH:ubiquinone oxidoreductase subunit I